jgi:hypothetical protein
VKRLLTAALAVAALFGSVAVGATVSARSLGATPVRPAVQAQHVAHAVTLGKKKKKKKKKAQPNSIKHPVPFGDSVAIDGWKVKFVSLAPFVPGEFESGPPAGYQFLVYVLQVTRTAKTPDSPVDSLTEVLVGSTKDQRGVDTDPICFGGTPYNNDVDQGGTVPDGDCISVPVNDTGLVLGVSPIFSLTNETVWFATTS